MANILSKEDQIQILTLLVEGNSIRSTSRITDCHKKTVTRVLVDAGNGCRAFLDAELRGLKLAHVQCDEIWTFVGKKQARLTLDEKDERFDIGDMFLFTGLDQETKLIPSFLVGKRSADNARKFMTDLAGRLVFPKPHESDPHAYAAGTRPVVVQISTDGFAADPEAVNLTFGAHVKYGVIIKEFRIANIVYQPSEIVGTKRRCVFGMNESEERSIATSHVERNNLTIRTFMKRFTILALGFSKKLANLEAAVALHLAYYNFCWRPRMQVGQAHAHAGDDGGGDGSALVHG